MLWCFMWCFLLLVQYSLDCSGYVEFAQTRSGKLPRVNVGNFCHGCVDALQVICLHDQHRLSWVEVELRGIKRVWERANFHNREREKKPKSKEANERVNTFTYRWINDGWERLMSKDSQIYSDDIKEMDKELNAYNPSNEKLCTCVCVRVCACTFMPFPRLSSELMSRPSLQACRQEITFWVAIFPGRIVKPERLPRKYCVNRGVVTSPPVNKHITNHAYIYIYKCIRILAVTSNKIYCTKAKDIGKRSGTLCARVSKCQKTPI